MVRAAARPEAPCSLRSPRTPVGVPCGARVFTSNLESFPGMIFVTLGSLDQPDRIEPKLEMFTKRRLEWAKPLDLPQFENMPG